MGSERLELTPGARPVGKWLRIPIGAALAAFGFAGLKYMRDDAESAASADDGDAS